MPPNFSDHTALTKNTCVVAIGGANIDVLGRAFGPLAKADSTPGEVRLAPGGVARNVAENLARLGVNAHLVSVVGADSFGEQLLRATQAAGVGVSAVSRVHEGRTGSYLSLHGPQGELACAINDMQLLDALTPEALAAHWALFCGASSLVMDCNLSADSLACLLNGDLKAPIFVDAVSAAKCLRIKPWLPRIHTLKLNRLEAQTLLGWAPIEGGAQARIDWAQGAALALHDLGVSNVVLSLGAQGAAWCGVDGPCGHSAGRLLEVVNTTGAGDALLAGLVFAHLRQMPLAQAVPWALRCAEITLQSPTANAANLSVEWVDRLHAGASF